MKSILSTLLETEAERPGLENGEQHQGVSRQGDVLGEHDQSVNISRLPARTTIIHRRSSSL